MPTVSSHIEALVEPAPRANWWLSRRAARLLTPLLLIFGAQCWLILGNGDYGHQHKPFMILCAVIAGLIPPVSRAFNWLWNAVARPSPLVRRATALAIWIGSSSFIYWTERYQHIPFKPQFEDEFSYLIQMRMLAHGRFWMPAIPLPQFFDSFYLIVKPVYASMYFPGTAIMYLPALLMHLPYTASPLVASGFCAAMLYLVFTEVLDGASAILAVLILLSLKMLRIMSILAMAQIPSLLLGLVMTWAVLQWRKKFETRWLFLLGAAGGWAAITRPADALCFAIVLGAVMASDLKGKPARNCATTMGCIAAAAVPFLILQLWLNHNIAGQWLTTPFARYNDVNYPGAFGFHSGPVAEHVSGIPEVQYFYDLYVKGAIEQHRLRNLFTIVLKGEAQLVGRVAIFDPFIWILMPISLLAMWDRRLWIVWGMLPVYCAVMSAYAFTWVLPHYFVVVIPTMILLFVLPIHFLTGIFPKNSAMIRTTIGLSIIALALAAMPQCDRLIDDQIFDQPELTQIDEDLASTVSMPAVVMFHFNRDAMVDGKKITNNPSEEPVFNSDVAWPDDAKIIHARDVNANVSAVGRPGDADRPLYAYYSRIDPSRVFYLYNRGAGADRLRKLGTARQLLQATEIPSKRQ